MIEPTEENPFAQSEANEADAIAQGSTIVRASATMSASGVQGPVTDLSKRIEDAMIAAVEACGAEGVTDPDEIRARKLAARDAVINS